MTINDKKPAENLRGKTDKSLKDERGKTDDYLEQKHQTVTDRAEDAISQNRIAADQARDESRAAHDQDKVEKRNGSQVSPSAKADDKSLMQERKRSDLAQTVEREKEDEFRTRERFQKRLIAEALFYVERKETDTNLMDERVRLDLAFDQNSNLLLSEKVAHDLTKTAVDTRDQFLAIASHDLKNPIGSILMSASLMRSEFSKVDMDIDSALAYLEIIERNAANMERMVSDLLDVERMGNNKLFLTTGKHDICAILQECKSLFEPIVKSKKFSMTAQTCPEPVYAQVDHAKLLQVLSNLIGNALKFTPAGGTINLSVERHADEVELSVTDTGPGIPEDKISKIFDRFSQIGYNDRRGLGLGLYISKWIVEAHNGRIWVDSELGKGCKFILTLPVGGAD